MMPFYWNNKNPNCKGHNVSMGNDHCDLCDLEAKAALPAAPKSPADGGEVMLKGVPCPKCGKKALEHPAHPHDGRARPTREYDKARRRSCKARFKLVEKPKSDKEE